MACGARRGDGSRHARRLVQERAAPTAFQRTSLHPKCNTAGKDCKKFSRGPSSFAPRATEDRRRMTRKSNPGSGGARSPEPLTERRKQPFSRKAAEPRRKNSTTSAVAWLWRDKDGTD